MNKEKHRENFVIATKEGRLYIKSSDFFKQAKIRETIEKLKNSELVKSIIKNKKNSGD